MLGSFMSVASNRENKCNGKSKLGVYFIDHRDIYIQYRERLRGGNSSITQPRRTSAVVGERLVRDAVFTGKTSPRTETSGSWRYD
jgi:hypothetical protein